MPSRRTLTVLPACAALAVAAAFAQPAAVRGAGPRSGLELTTTVEQLTEVASGDGSTAQRLVPFAAAAPGAVVVYTVAFENVSSRTLENVRITNPIPAEMTYVASSAAGPGSRVLFSIDGGRTFGAPAELGAPADTYTHIRWLLPAPLDAGARGFVRFRAVIK